MQRASGRGTWIVAEPAPVDRQPGVAASDRRRTAVAEVHPQLRAVDALRRATQVESRGSLGIDLEVPRNEGVVDVQLSQPLQRQQHDLRGRGRRARQVRIDRRAGEAAAAHVAGADARRTRASVHPERTRIHRTAQWPAAGRAASHRHRTFQPRGPSHADRPRRLRVRIPGESAVLAWPAARRRRGVPRADPCTRGATW
jgi:hypothetical protein